MIICEPLKRGFCQQWALQYDEPSQYRLDSRIPHIYKYIYTYIYIYMYMYMYIFIFRQIHIVFSGLAQIKVISRISLWHGSVSLENTCSRWYILFGWVMSRIRTFVNIYNPFTNHFSTHPLCRPQPCFCLQITQRQQRHRLRCIAPTSPGEVSGRSLDRLKE